MTTIKRTRKGVDELIHNVVAQGNVAMTNKGKATFRLPIVRLNPNVPAQENFIACNNGRPPLGGRARRGGSGKKVTTSN